MKVLLQVASSTKVEAEVKQYGAYVEISDLLEMTSYDPVIADSAELLGEQLGTVIEWVTRDAMCETTNVQYANGAASRVALTASDKLTVNEVRKAVRTLKKNKARPFVTGMDGSARKPHFICICSPDATYDLQNDSLWQDVSKYSNAEQIYAGDLRELPGVPLRGEGSCGGGGGPSGLRWVWRNGRGPHLEGRQEPQASSAFRTPTAGSLQSWDRRVRPRLV